jgi:polysaccharide pyruvyl transferase WcaK-like protein
VYAESIGPFHKRQNQLLAKFMFDRFSLITVRETLSKDCLDALGVKNPNIFVTADSAFLLKPAPFSRINEILTHEGITKSASPIIGMSVSSIISKYGFPDLSVEKKYGYYVALMSQIVDYLTKKYGATVVFVPHVIDPQGSDDRVVAEDICRLLKDKSKVYSIKTEYTCDELKGIISQCDLFIGARMHATIAATSMTVPTIAIAYSQKTHGIIGSMLGYEKYVLDIADLNYDNLVSVIDDAWANRGKIKSDLSKKIAQIKTKSRLNNVLVKKLID